MQVCSLSINRTQRLLVELKSLGKILSCGRLRRAERSPSRFKIAMNLEDLHLLRNGREADKLTNTNSKLKKTRRGR